MFERLFTSTLAYLETSGTVASRSSPEMAGTGACLIGSIFMAMVPPVAKNSTTGFASSANADGAIRQTRAADRAANLLRIGRPPARASNEHSGGPDDKLFRHLAPASSVTRRLGLFSAKRRRCSADKADRAIGRAQRARLQISLFRFYRLARGAGARLDR